MPIEFIQMPTITVHFNGEADAPEVEYNFDPEGPRPWTPYLNVNVCQCAKHLPAGHIEQVIREAIADMQPASQADTIARIAAGEPTVDEKGVLEILRVGTTKLGELRNQGRVPDPILGVAGRNLWLRADIQAAYAAILAGNAVRKQAGSTKRKAPKNRYARVRP
jgi:hypothetical protein